jgi:hypothetical protein
MISAVFIKFTILYLNSFLLIVSLISDEDWKIFVVILIEKSKKIFALYSVANQN